MFARLKTWLGLDYYVSPLDSFLKKFNDPARKLTASEQREIEKHRRLAKARDQAITPPSQPAAWRHW